MTFEQLLTRAFTQELPKVGSAEQAALGFATSSRYAVKLVITWQGIGGLNRFKRQIRDLNEKFPGVLPRKVNQVADRAKTRVARQTGLNGAVVPRAVKNSKRAFSGQLTYDLKSRGGNIRLKCFQPKETEVGVSANPWAAVRYMSVRSWSAVPFLISRSSESSAGTFTIASSHQCIGDTPHLDTIWCHYPEVDD